MKQTLEVGWICVNKELPPASVNVRTYWASIYVLLLDENGSVGIGYAVKHKDEKLVWIETDCEGFDNEIKPIITHWAYATPTTEPHVESIVHDVPISNHKLRTD